MSVVAAAVATGLLLGLADVSPAPACDSISDGRYELDVTFPDCAVTP